MTPDAEVRKQLLHLLRGGNAHMTFDQAIADFPPEHFNTKPPNVSYSFWHLLEHLRIAQWDILEFVRRPEHASPAWPKGYWPHPDAQADQAAWDTTIRKFHADLQALQVMAENPEVNLTAPLPHAPDYTVLRELLLVADHNAYHIGEFGILRQITGLWPQGH